MLYDAGPRGMVEVDEIVESWRGPTGVIRSKDKPLLFDAGKYGIIEVEQIEYHPDCVMGFIHTYDNYHRIVYSNHGKQGCSRSDTIPPKDMSPEAREKQRQIILARGRMILNEQMRQEWKAQNAEKNPYGKLA